MPENELVLFCSLTMRCRADIDVPHCIGNDESDDLNGLKPALLSQLTRRIHWEIKVLFPL